MKNLDKSVVWHPFNPLKGGWENLSVKSAKGCTLYLEDGSEILDAISSWWVTVHGHGNERMAEAIYKQALELEHVIFSGFSHRPAVELSNKLLDLFDRKFSKVFFSDDGSTSVEVAMKMAIHYWHNKGEEKTKVIALEGAYHGDTFGVMSASGKGDFNKPFSNFLFDVHQLPFPNENNFDKVKQVFTEWCSQGDVAFFVFEPLLQGVAGMRTYTPNMLNELMQIARDHDVLNIADEVLTGFYRLGKPFAHSYLNSSADLVCLSKALTGGLLPMGVTLASSKVVETFNNNDINKTFYHGHSYTASPISCAAGLESLKIFSEQKTLDNIQMIASKHEKAEKEFRKLKGITRINRIGTIISLEIEQNQSGYHSSIRNKLYNAFINKGFLLRPLGNVVYILPPYTITESELDSIYNVIMEELVGLGLCEKV